jgi:hypothetical protein
MQSIFHSLFFSYVLSPGGPDNRGPVLFTVLVIQINAINYSSPLLGCKHLENLVTGDQYNDFSLVL